MKREINVISARLSLRQPQRESLEILADILEQISLDPDVDLTETLCIIQSLYPSVTDFEREFPSLCFSLATGVGKTRLMGAFIAYIHTLEISRHFFILAPNLTIYEKLIRDFSPSSLKYVFKGIAEFANNPPIIITGENYQDGRGVRFEYSGQGRILENTQTAYINIFNISKINSEVRGGKSPRMKRLQEYIGDSYFNYLSSLDDLVLLMDEAHRYRASAGVKAINELKPILGLELTATPKTVGANPIEFKNVVYHYPLASALRDGFVKEPAVATRKGFRPDNYSKEQLERIKLEDGIHHHEHVKVELEIYAKQNDIPKVKPFILVVAQDTTHAKELSQHIESNDFFEGRYKGRVIEIHTNQSGTESDDAMQRLLSVEKDDTTEIVIHVNKLKEGWDVTNLYTIVPLRASASEILTEQTIGRGLRLPYGKRTGVNTVDRLTIIAHDRFQDIIDQANSPDSIIKQHITIGVGGDIPPEKAQSVTVPSIVETVLTGNAPEFSAIASEAKSGTYIVTKNQELLLSTPQERNIATITLEVLKKYERLESSEQLKTPETQAKIVSDVKELLPPSQMVIQGIESEPDIPKVVELVTQKITELTIDIPNIVLLPTREVTFGFHDFDLEHLTIRPQPVSQEILIQHIRTNEKSFLMWNSTQAREVRLENYIVRSLINQDEIDYDENAELLYKLSGQLVTHLRSYLSDEKEIENVLLYHQKSLSDFILAEMMKHYWETPTDYVVRISKGFTVLKSNNFNLPAGTSPKYFRDTLPNPSAIRQMVFGGFERCCYPYQKFDVDSERRFAVLLEDEPSVIRWMKPGSGHFQIEYRSSLRYEPDFVVETKTEKLICEPKRKDEIQDDTVQAKARAAVKWCAHATQHAKEHSGKPWSYLLIPHDEIQFNQSLDRLKSDFAIS
jgi:type III restriction enzyme